MTMPSPPRSRRPRIPVSRLFTLLLSVAVVITAAGCRSSGKGGGGGKGVSGDSSEGAREFADATAAEMRVEAMAAADVCVTTIAQALDELRASTKRPEVA